MNDLKHFKRTGNWYWGPLRLVIGIHEKIGKINNKEWAIYGNGEKYYVKNFKAHKNDLIAFKGK